MSAGDSRSNLSPAPLGSSFLISTWLRSQAPFWSVSYTHLLPHNLARVVLLEQIYRACKISRGEPYHK